MSSLPGIELKAVGHGLWLDAVFLEWLEGHEPSKESALW
jgi:hypothetical protein